MSKVNFEISKENQNICEVEELISTEQESFLMGLDTSSMGHILSRFTDMYEKPLLSTTHSMIVKVLKL